MKKLAIIGIALIALSAFGYLAAIHYIASHYNEREDKEDEGQLPENLAGEWGAFQLIGTPYKPSDKIIYSSPKIIVDTQDAWSLIPIKVNKVVKGKSPYKEGTTVVLKVHSPSLTGLKMNEPYSFMVNGDKDSSGKWQYYLTAIDLLKNEMK